MNDNNYHGFFNAEPAKHQPAPTPPPPGDGSGAAGLVALLVVGALLFVIAWPIALIIATLWGIGWLLTQGGKR